MANKLVTLTDYDGDRVEIDCRSDLRFYIDTYNENNAESGCVNLDRPAARTIIAVLQNWLGDDKTHSIKKTTITFED